MDADKIAKSTTTDGQPPRPGFEHGGAPSPIDPKTGQRESYWVLRAEERAKGFVRPVRTKYIHLACRTQTRMGLALSETYARDPKYYGATFCCYCQKHFPLRTADGWQFVWDDHQANCADGEPVGSTEAEAKAYLAEVQLLENEKHKGAGI